MLVKSSSAVRSPLFLPQERHERDSPSEHQSECDRPFEPESGLVFEFLDLVPVPSTNGDSTRDFRPEILCVHDRAGRQEEPFERGTSVLECFRLLHVEDGQSEGRLALQ